MVTPLGLKLWSVRHLLLQQLKDLLGISDFRVVSFSFAQTLCAVNVRNQIRETMKQVNHMNVTLYCQIIPFVVLPPTRINGRARVLISFYRNPPASSKSLQTGPQSQSSRGGAGRCRPQLAGETVSAAAPAAVGRLPRRASAAAPRSTRRAAAAPARRGPAAVAPRSRSIDPSPERGSRWLAGRSSWRRVGGSQGAARGGGSAPHTAHVGRSIWDPACFLAGSSSHCAPRVALPSPAVVLVELVLPSRPG